MAYKNDCKHNYDPNRCYACKDERIEQLEGLLEGCTKWANEASSFLKGNDKMKELETCASHLSAVMLLTTKDEVWNYLLAWHKEITESLGAS